MARCKFHGNTYNLVDLPGTYSLTSYTMEERVARNYILNGNVDVIVNVIDASTLERNLYLTLQLLELGKPVVLALNMMDIVRERGLEIDFHRLPEMLGVPAIPTSARTKEGLDILMHAIEHHSIKDKNGNSNINKYYEHEHDYNIKHNLHLHKEYAMVYSEKIEIKIKKISERILEKYTNIKNVRWYAIKFLEKDQEILEKYKDIKYDDIIDKSYEQELIKEKYDFIEEVMQECVVHREAKKSKTDKIDKILTHRIWGLPIFLCVMAIVFILTFVVGDLLKGKFEILLNWLINKTSLFLDYINMGQIGKSLILDGILSGVGGILTFIPNIFILFIALAFLEDSGYMSRVAYVMNSKMEKLGLSGRAFVPMILGFGCTVPAVMASRVLENKKDRLKTILITPFMSCSAKIPVYVLFSSMFFGKYAALVAFSMYIIGLIMAFVVAKIVSKLDKTEKIENALLIELPEYKSPNMRSIAIYVWEKIKDYLIHAGTTIFVASIIVWGLLNFGPNGFTGDITQSFGSMIGKIFVPIMKPIGLGYWQIVLALIAGIAGKEVVVSTMSVI